MWPLCRGSKPPLTITVLGIGLLLNQRRAGDIVDRALDLGPLVVGLIDGASKLDELVVKLLPLFLHPDPIFDLPKLRVDRLELGFEIGLPVALCRSRQVEKFLLDVDEFESVGDALGLDLQDADLVENLTDANRDLKHGQRWRR